MISLRCSAVAVAVGWFARLVFGMYPSPSFPTRHDASDSGVRGLIIAMYKPYKLEHNSRGLSSAKCPNANVGFDLQVAPAYLCIGVESADSAKHYLAGILP